MRDQREISEEFLGDASGLWSTLRSSLILLFVVLFPMLGHCAETCRLAENGKALREIVISKNACPTSKHMAEELAGMLQKIAGAKFAVKTGDGKQGLAVGMVSEFPELSSDPALKLKQYFSANDLVTRQSYLLHSHKDGVQIIGASELAVDYAVWDFLYHLGYRQFFPSKTWEIIPKKPNLSITVDDYEKPDFIQRQVGSTTLDWCERNRLSLSKSWKVPFKSYLPEYWQLKMIQNQHNWGSIIAHSKDEFKLHPEYLGLVTVEKGETFPLPPELGDKAEGGNLADIENELKPETETEKDDSKEKIQKRASSKLCVSNPGVVKAAIRYAKDYFSKNDSLSISMEPTDGSGWCECPECAKIGPPSERVAFLANAVAKALEKDYPDRYIGVLAYNLHANAPKRMLHPRVVVNLATQLSGKVPLAKRLENWSKVCQNLGVYEYLSVMEWHLGLPAKSKISNLPFLKKSLPQLYRTGVRFYTGQATGSAWGAQGLGFVVISRLLWDIDEAKHIDRIVDDFLTKAFGPAAEAMRDYYHVVDASQAKPGSYAFFLDRAKQMYAALRKAKKLTKDPVINERINQLILYTRYVELFGLSGQAKGMQKWKILEHLVRHVYRMRDKGMIGFGVITGYIKDAKKVELRPPRVKSGTLEESLKEDRPFVHVVDRPFTEKDISDILNGKANTWQQARKIDKLDDADPLDLLND